MDGKSVATFLLAAGLLASAGCQSAPSGEDSDRSTIVRAKPSGAQLRGEPGDLCPLTRVVTSKGAFAKAILVCGPDPSLPQSAREWVVTNNSEGVLRATPGSSSQGLKVVAPPTDDADPVPGASAQVVPTGPDRAGSVLVPAHGNVRVTGGYPVQVRVDYEYSAESVLTASILKVGLREFGGQYLKSLATVKACTTGTRNILAKYAGKGREGASFFAAAKSDYVRNPACRIVFATLQAGSNRVAAAELVDTIFKDIAERSWRRLAELINQDPLELVPKISR